MKKEKDVVVCIGDWCQKKQMKYKEPTKGMGIRRTLRKNGFDVYLVYEDNTSCKYSKCYGECEVFRTCENPRPWKKNEIILRHGLLMCKTCKRLWNRDENSSRNIHKIAWCAIHKKQKPEYLCREKETINQWYYVGITKPKITQVTIKFGKPNFRCTDE